MKVKLPYATVNDLNERIIRRMGSEMANTGKKVTKKDVIIDLANYCNVSPEKYCAYCKKLFYAIIAGGDQNCSILQCECRGHIQN